MVYLGIPVYNHFDRSIVALLLMIWKRMFKAHTQAELANNYWMQFCSWTWRVPQKAGTFVGRCVWEIGNFNDDLRNVPTNFELSWNHGDGTQKPIFYSQKSNFFCIFTLHNISDFNSQIISVTIFPFPFT